MCKIEFAKRLSDEEVLLLLKRCVHDERRMTAQLLIHFGEVNDRGLFRDEGYSSMFDYAVRGLNMSEGEARLRMRAARIVREFPQALEMLIRGELHLTALRLLSYVLTEYNTELLSLARHKTKAEVEKLIAEHFPKPDVKDEVRKLVEQTQPAVVAHHQRSAIAERTSTPLPCLTLDPDLDPAGAGDPRTQSPSDDSRTARVMTPSAQPRAAHVNVQAPLGRGRYKVQFTASERVNHKLEQAKELLRREVPTGDLEAVFERALDLLIADRKKKMFGLTEKPRARAARTKSPSKEAKSRYVPREVRRRVYARDQGQCAFEAANGTRCSARARLEFHHIIAFELDGPTTFENLELRCRAHNMLEAERDFGRDTVLKRIESQRAARKSSRLEQHCATSTDFSGSSRSDEPRPATVPPA